MARRNVNKRRAFFIFRMPMTGKKPINFVIKFIVGLWSKGKRICVLFDITCLYQSP